MARKKNIRFLLKQELNTMASYGRSKYDDQKLTEQERRKQRANGVSYRESLRTDYCKKHIYSYVTMKTYQKNINQFANYLEMSGHKKISIEESKKYIQPYIDYLMSKNLTSATIHNYLAAACKATGAYLFDYEHPSRSVAKITKGVKPVDLDAISDPLVKMTLEANRLLGLRHSELMRLKAGDILEKDDFVIVRSVGKGGKQNQQLFIFEDEKEAVLKLKEGKTDNERVFPKSYFRQKNYHKMRELRAKDLYERVCRDMETRGEVARQEYQDIIKTVFAENHKTLKENLDNPVYVRSENRERLMKAGRSIVYDRTALLFVSVSVTSHFRSSVTLNHYVAK